MDEKIKNCGRPIESFENTFRTAAFSQPFLLLEELKGVNSEMVGGTGIEPVTPCVSSKCSTPELTAHTLRVEGIELRTCRKNIKPQMHKNDKN